MTRLATCSGFRSDVLPAVRACGAAVELGDHVPFTELFGEADRGFVVVLVAAAIRLRAGEPLALEEMFADPCVDQGGTTARALHADAVRALAAFDDLALSSLWNDAWAAVGRSGQPSGDLTQAIRGLVVQCRAAVANGWEVFVVEQAPAS